MVMLLIHKTVSMRMNYKPRDFDPDCYENSTDNTYLPTIKELKEFETNMMEPKDGVVKASKRQI
jgi:hypothetical protein